MFGNFFLSSSSCAKGYMIIYSTKSLDQSLICICFLPINVRLLCTTLQQQFWLYISFLWIAQPQPKFPHSCVCERFIYSHIFPPGRPIAGIYNSLTDTWMWKWGLRPRYSFSQNICFKFSAFCLCKVKVNLLGLR